MLAGQGGFVGSDSTPCWCRPSYLTQSRSSLEINLFILPPFNRPRFRAQEAEALGGETSLTLGLRFFCISFTSLSHSRCLQTGDHFRGACQRILTKLITRSVSLALTSSDSFFPHCGLGRFHGQNRYISIGVGKTYFVIIWLSSENIRGQVHRHDRSSSRQSHHLRLHHGHRCPGRGNECGIPEQPRQ